MEHHIDRSTIGTTSVPCTTLLCGHMCKSPTVVNGNEISRIGISRHHTSGHDDKDYNEDEDDEDDDDGRTSDATTPITHTTHATHHLCGRHFRCHNDQRNIRATASVVE